MIELNSTQNLFGGEIYGKQWIENFALVPTHLYAQANLGEEVTINV